MKPHDIPASIIDAMASAMLSPELRASAKGSTPALPTGNIVRIRVLLRALEDAQNLGYELTKQIVE